MASTTRALSRMALLISRRPLTGRPQTINYQIAPIGRQTRFFSPSSFTYLPEDPPVPPEPRDFSAEDVEDLPEYSPNEFTGEEKTMYEMMSSEERAVFDEENRRFVEMWNDTNQRAKDFSEVEQAAARVEREQPMRFEDAKLKHRGFWADEEEDEFAAAEEGDEDFNDDEITSMAHAELEQHREVREYARIAAWDMPLLSKLAKPFSLPTENQLLRFRYTTYMGEQHPAENKVVVELSSKDLVPKHLTEEQRQTFLKLVGTRYNPDTDIVHMSTEKHVTRAQNKRYLGDLVKTLIKEAKTGDSFKDVPLDLRYHKPKQQFIFPESWKVTETRQKQLAAAREERYRTERERLTIVDGKEAITNAIRTLPALSQATRAPEEQRAAVRVGTGNRRPVTSQRSRR